ncbi:hypothetical protein ANAPRD1_01299 [Anaplasma phagocytophilum]|nr:hypothetical protein ANAPC5_01494 [Anaplasma phagocytophilum]SCV66782.1 hypothetical protein ANAPRD1_01299 [Anaplasma phagocytophilum]
MSRKRHDVGCHDPGCGTAVELYAAHASFPVAQSVVRQLTEAQQPPIDRSHQPVFLRHRCRGNCSLSARATTLLWICASAARDGTSCHVDWRLPPANHTKPLCPGRSGVIHCCGNARDTCRAPLLGRTWRLKSRSVQRCAIMIFPKAARCTCLVRRRILRYF